MGEFQSILDSLSNNILGVLDLMFQAVLLKPIVTETHKIYTVCIDFLSNKIELNYVGKLVIPLTDNIQHESIFVKHNLQEYLCYVVEKLKDFKTLNLNI